MGSSRRVAGVAVSAAVIGACSGSDNHRALPADAGSPDAILGSGGSPGTGGRPSTGGGAGVPAAGGSSGSAGKGGAGGGPLEAGPDGSEAGPRPFVCKHTTVPDGGDAASAVNEWRDWASHACVACPSSTPLTCDKVAGARILFDSAAKRLTITVSPGVAEIVRGTVSFSWDALLADGGYAYGTASAPLVVTENTLVADLTSSGHPGIASIYGLTIDVDDACGQHSTITGFASAARPDDGGSIFNIHCEQ